MFHFNLFHPSSALRNIYFILYVPEISSTCEDALINCSGEAFADEPYQSGVFDAIPSVLSSATVTDQWIRRGPAPSLTGNAPVGKSRAVLYRRGKAWVGLERAREAVGWLPSDVLNSTDQNPVEEEDPERLVIFDDVKNCLLELWKPDEKPSATDHLDFRAYKAYLQQRLLLLCLEFLGAYNPEVAEEYYFPSGRLTLQFI